MNMRWSRSVRLMAFILIAVLATFGVAATVWAQAGGGAAGGGAAQEPTPGTIVIIKDAVPDDPQVFSFDGDLGAFTLDDDPITSTLPNTRTFPNLQPGRNYGVSETVPLGWVLSSITCRDPDGGTIVGGTKASIDLDAGETVTCIFTNSKIDVRAPDLAIAKEGVVSPDGQKVTYTIKVTNVGTMPAIGILVDDVLISPPPGSTFVSASGSGWSCTGMSGPGPVACTYSGIIAPGDPPLTITIVVDVGPSGGEFENCATVSHEVTAAGPPDSNLDNNKACVKTSVLLSCPAPVTTIFTAGVKDDFSTANGLELSSPSAALLAFMVTQSAGTQDFDGTSFNRVFGHTFTGLPPGIVGAKLEIQLRVIGDFSSNDSISLAMTGSSSFAWSANIGALAGVPWTTGESAVLTLNLAALPNILSNIKTSNTLDVYVQDDTAVDYIILTVVTCPGTIVIIKDTVPDGPQVFSFDGSLGTFKLDDDPITSTLPNTQTFVNLQPGTYTVTETAVTGWVSSVTCKDPDGGTVVGGASAKIDLDAGETVTCIFTNRQDVRPPSTTYIYSVKIACGTVRPPRPKPDIPTLRDPSPVVPGLYRTAVNIHNFRDEATAFQHKVVIALPLDQPRGPVTKLVDEKLGANEAVEVDCHNIVALLLEGTTSAKAEFLKGFLVIESPVELEVTAVYTAEELQENGISIDVEQIQPHVQRNERPTASTASPAPGR